MKDPIVLEPKGFDMEAAWGECAKYAGGNDYFSASRADPGCCTCPNCHEYFWAWGRLIQCTECSFIFPTDWWPMYSYGVNAAHNAYSDRLHAERLTSSYYQYGFEHPVEDAWVEHDKIDWKAVIGQPQDSRT